MSTKDQTMKTLGMLPKDATEIHQAPFQQALGDLYTKVDATPIGRHRLLTMLKTKYGANYRNHPVSQNAISHFDSEQKRVENLVRLRSGRWN